MTYSAHPGGMTEISRWLSGSDTTGSQPPESDRILEGCQNADSRSFAFLASLQDAV